MTTFEHLLAEQAGPLTGRLARLVGDRDLAEDLRQEVLLRAWRAAPRDASAGHLCGWLHRTATNVAIDELRRRGRRPGAAPLPETLVAPTGPTGPAAGDATAALELLTAHQRMVLLLRFEAGLSLRELGELLDIGEDAARKRVARARTAFAAALRDVRAEDDRPTVMVLMGRDDPEPYRAWLSAAGARVRFIGPDQPGLDLAGADALVLSGSTTDVHARTYGEEVDPRSVAPDLTRDLRDLQALRMALASDLPVVGVCRGAQLLSVLYGGALSQHVEDHGGDRPHALQTLSGSAVARALGDRPEIVSDHHQAVKRLGRGLRVTAVAPDGLPEAVEVPGRRLALGTQWHPERGGCEGLATLLVEEAARCAA